MLRIGTAFVTATTTTSTTTTTAAAVVVLRDFWYVTQHVGPRMTMISTKNCLIVMIVGPLDGKTGPLRMNTMILLVRGLWQYFWSMGQALWGC